MAHGPENSTFVSWMSSLYFRRRRGLLHLYDDQRIRVPSSDRHHSDALSSIVLELQRGETPWPKNRKRLRRRRPTLDDPQHQRVPIRRRRPAFHRRYKSI